MLTFEELLSRASDPTLQELVGRKVVRLLAKLQEDLAHPDRLREVLQDLRAPSELLLNRDSRAELASLLPPSQARDLATALDLPGDDPFRELSSVSIRRGSERARRLLEFFYVQDESPPVRDAPTSTTVTVGHGLFPHQRNAARQVLSLLEAEPQRALLHMPTGSGKTRTAMNAICELMNRSEPFLAVWLAHSEELCEQAVEEFSSAWQSLGNRDVPVARWWGDHELDAMSMRDGLLVAGLPKAYASVKRDFRQLGQLSGQVGLVVMDEAHQAIAPSYQLVLDLLSQAGSPAPLLGLSATPGRTWNDVDEDQKLADFFYRRKVTLRVGGYDNPVDYLVDEGYLAAAQFESLHSKIGVELTQTDYDNLADGLDLPARVLEQLADDEKRNLLIVNRAEQITRTTARLIIFAATVEHAVVLAAVLRSRGLWARAVTGKTPSSERAQSIGEFRDDSPEPRVLVNYGVLTTGFDAPATGAAIIARPTASLVLYSQMVGRAIRGPRAGGNARAVIATVVDPGLEGFASPSDAFENWEDVWETAR
ncbi:DEAD/DEAH box helicase [Nocardioides coralli]|uniref:DEAD/DEAH box helicase n=1 Tax=Nocardioides coralli TaxID=2872154 RepID=UPI001CA456E1|nr:DEAD/DEAH box helicase [Nocardioides coralli]QZY29687.1 DEAD/DEAH box helicase [Nocardioides coralli]